eukprot:12876919-Ditylum_brightwellii.AAC.1
MLIDLPSSLFVGDEPPPIIWPQTRHLQACNPWVQFKYTSYLQTYIMHHHLLEKYYAILANPPTSNTASELQLNALDKQQGEVMRAAEKRCRKLKMGIVDYSPEVNLLGKQWCVWKMVVLHKQKQNIKTE